MDKKMKGIKQFILNMAITGLLLNLAACNDDNMKNATKIAVGSNAEISDDFKTQNPAWKAYAGHWVFKNGVLEQNSTQHDFPVILREDKQFADLEVSVDFKPVSGNIDASGGIIFRAKDKDNYYIVRANALEDNYRLYTFVNGRRQQLASATVSAPEKNKFHNMRIVARGDHIQAYLDGKLQIDYHDDTYQNGFSGLWTKEDSITQFDNFKAGSLSE